MRLWRHWTRLNTTVSFYRQPRTHTHPPGESSNRDLLRIEKKRLRNFLGISDHLQDDQFDFEEPRAEGSCEWLTETKGFLRWRDDSVASLHVLFAPPAMGKSYMADYVREHLQSLGNPCSSFFFHSRETALTSLSRCLTFLAYDMACQNRNIRYALLKMEEDGVRIEADGDHYLVIWRKLFVGSILQQELYRHHYWVVDALDECKKQGNFLPLLAQIPSSFPLKVFVTSRPSHELLEQFKKFENPPISQEILPEYARGDIGRYLEAHTHFLTSDNPSEGSELIQTILDRSEGCFLWAKLVVQGLKRVRSVKTTGRILQRVPTGMNELYSRTLSDLSEAPAYSKPLIKAILRWAACCWRPLTISELKQALIMDIEDEVQNLEHQVASLCNHLVFVDAQMRLKLVHPTARSFLLDPGNASEFTFSERDGHQRLAYVCLKYLCSTEMRAPRARRSGQTVQRSPFLNYVAISFFEHINYCTTADVDIFTLLGKFLRDPHRNLLTWIEYVASLGDLAPLIRAGMVLTTYMKRRAKHLPAIGPDAKAIQMWSTDLTRIVAKFGHNLRLAPSSIFNVIPPMSPKSSALYSQYGKSSGGISILGLSENSWDDRLASLNFPDSMATAVACKPNFFAIGLSDKLVRVYHTATCQELAKLPHGERIRILEFNISGQLLVSVGRKMARIWDVPAQKCMACFPISCPCIAATLTLDGKELVLVGLDNQIYTFSVESGEKQRSEQLYVDMGHSRRLSKPPDTAAFSLEHKLLAFVYRGGHINIWDWSEDVLQAICEKPGAETQTLPFHATSLVFNPAPDSDSIVAAYQDGELMVFSALDGVVKANFKAESSAATLACSPDGRVLISGDPSGTIRIFDFETFENYRLKMFHVIYSRKDNIRALAFCDNFRFVDLRESQINIWEPGVLVRQERNENNSDTVSVDFQELVVAEPADTDEILCMDIDQGRGLIFCGTEAGEVNVYSLETGQKLQTLFKQFVSVTQICFDPGKRILATADSASRVIVHQLSNAQSECALHSRLLGGHAHRMNESIEQLVFDPTSTKLHIATLTQDDLCHLDGSKSYQTNWDTRDRGIWISNPQDANQNLLIARNRMSVFSWHELKRLTSPDHPIEMILDGGNSLPAEFELKSVHVGGQGRVLLTEYSDSIRKRSRTRLYM